MTTLARAPEPGTRARRLGGPLATAATVGAGALALRLRDPHVEGSWGLCPFQELTGWSCPLCGGLRAVNDLGHGELAAAAHSNLLLVAAVPVLVGLWAWWTTTRWTGKDVTVPPQLTRRLLVGVLALAVVFTVVRNLPWAGGWQA